MKLQMEKKALEFKTEWSKHISLKKEDYVLQDLDRVSTKDEDDCNLGLNI